jgi:hypothetical protein
MCLSFVGPSWLCRIYEIFVICYAWNLSFLCVIFQWPGRLYGSHVLFLECVVRIWSSVIGPNDVYVFSVTDFECSSCLCSIFKWAFTALQLIHVHHSGCICLMVRL